MSGFTSDIAHRFFGGTLHEYLPANKLPADRLQRRLNLDVKFLMLRELPPKQQPDGEPIRRWFFSHEQDLVVWLDGDAQIRGFQLCYDKYKSEHAITWRCENGFEHSVVDDGESGGLDFQTPFLYPNGYCDINRVLTKFAEISSAVPTDIVVFVIERLREYPSEIQLQR